MGAEGMLVEDMVPGHLYRGTVSGKLAIFVSVEAGYPYKLTMLYESGDVEIITHNTSRSPVNFELICCG